MVTWQQILVSLGLGFVVGSSSLFNRRKTNAIKLSSLQI